MKGSLVGAVIAREWRTRVFKRSFLLGTLLMPFLGVGLIALTVLLTEGGETDNRILVEDMPGLITRMDLPVANLSRGVQVAFPKGRASPTAARGRHP